MNGGGFEPPNLFLETTKRQQLCILRYKAIAISPIRNCTSKWSNSRANFNMLGQLVMA